MPDKYDLEKERQRHLRQLEIQAELIRQSRGESQAQEGEKEIQSSDLVQEYKMDPGVDSEKRNLEIEKKISDARHGSKLYNMPAHSKPTLHDPEKFQDLITVKSGLGQIKDIQKMSGSEIDSLRSTVKKKDSASVRIGQSVSLLFRNMTSSIAGVFAKTEKGAKSQCEIYGHRIDMKGWREGYPRCTDCGVTVRSKEQLRKASLEQYSQEFKPYDNRLEL